MSTLKDGSLSDLVTSGEVTSERREAAVTVIVSSFDGCSLMNNRTLVFVRLEGYIAMAGVAPSDEVRGAGVAAELSLLALTDFGVLLVDLILSVLLVPSMWAGLNWWWAL